MYAAIAPVKLVGRPPSEKEIRAALNSALDGTLPFEGWEQPAWEVLTEPAVTISARASALLWDDSDVQTDPVFERWWAAARQTLIDELAAAYLAFATTYPDQELAPTLRLRRRSSARLN